MSKPAEEGYPIEAPKPGVPTQRACRILAQSTDVDERVLRALSDGAKRYSELKPVLDGRNDHNLTVALERLQEEGLVRRRSGGGEGRDIHRYELSGLGHHTILTIDDLRAPDAGPPRSEAETPQVVDTEPLDREDIAAALEAKIRSGRSQGDTVEIAEVLDAAGITVDEQRVEALAGALEDTDVELAIQTARETESESRRPVWHVTPTRDGRWRVIRENASKAASVHSRKDEALDAARELARKRSSGRVVIHRRNGQIQEARTYAR